MSYGEVHRRLLRTVAGKGCITLAEAEQVVNNIDSEERYNIEDVVLKVNEQIQPLQQHLKIVVNELTEEKFIIYLQVALDAATRSANIFTTNELEYFRKLLESIVMSDRRQLTLAAALNLTPTGKITKTDAEKLLNTWCRMQYLEKTDNCYGLGIRGIHEFEAFIRRNMPDCIEDCTLCKQVVFQGCNCPNCQAAVHLRCLNKYLEKVEKWPCCKVEFNGLPAHNVSGDRIQDSSQSEPEPQGVQHAELTNTMEYEEQQMEVSQQEDEPPVSQCVADKRRKRPRLE